MLRFLGLTASAFCLVACGASQADISAAVAYHCEWEDLDARIEYEGETPELGLARSAAEQNLSTFLNDPSMSEDVYAAIQDADCP